MNGIEDGKMRLIALALVSFILLGCETTGGGSTAAPDTSEVVDQGTYKIGIGDGLVVSVWKNPELSSTLAVRPDGYISIPLLGDVLALGKEPESLADDIKTQLANYVKSPQVTVVVTNAVSSEFLHRVRVTGAVRAPASLPHQKGMTVMDLVLLTGGLTEFAEGNQTRLYRNTVSGPKVYAIRLDDILEKGDISTNYEIFPGDIITVPDSLF